MSSIDEQRWEQLMTSINDISSNLSSSHKDLSSKIQATNDYLESINKKVDIHEGRIAIVENNGALQNKAVRAKNIVLYRLEDTDVINNNLIAVINELFAELELNIPDLAKADAFRLGKVRGNRPVLIKFVAERWVKQAFSKVQEFRSFNLVIANDRTAKERENRRQLLKARHSQTVGDQMKPSSEEAIVPLPENSDVQEHRVETQPESSGNFDTPQRTAQKRKIISKLNDPIRKPKKGRPSKNQMDPKENSSTVPMTKFLTKIKSTVIKEKIQANGMEDDCKRKENIPM